MADHPRWSFTRGPKYSIRARDEGGDVETWAVQHYNGWQRCASGRLQHRFGGGPSTKFFYDDSISRVEAFA